MKKLFGTVIAVLFSVMLGVTVFGEDHTSAIPVAYDLPVVAVLPDGTHLDVIDYRGKSICLPGNVYIGEVSFIYTGSEKLYLPDSGEYVEPYGEFSYDISVGKQSFYEYISSGDKFYRYDLTVMQGSPVPSLYIEFDDGYSFDVLSYLGKSKENSVTGSLCMTDKDGNILYDGTLDNIRCRGNSSFGSPGLQGDKRSFNFKLTEKAELIGGAGQMRKWSLLHMRLDVEYDYDLTGLSTLTAFKAYDDLNGDEYYSNKAECVDVYIEGEYRGAYLLVERLDVNAAVDIYDGDKDVEGELGGYETVKSSDDPAIAAGVSMYRYAKGVSALNTLDITGGYVLEVTGSPDRCGFSTSRGVVFDIKAPELCTKEQVQYIATFVQGFEDALYSPDGYNGQGKHYSEYADLRSIADGVLTYAFYQNWELMRTSTYFYKDVDGSEHERLTFGPVWDFETGAQTLTEDGTLFGKHNFYNEYRQYVWIEQLWRHGDFMAVAHERATVLSEYMHRLLDGEEAEVYAFLEGRADSMSMNWYRFGMDKATPVRAKFRDLEPTYTAHAEHHIEALRTRLSVWDGLWSQEHLLGADTESVYDDGTGEYVLTVLPVGTADGCQWYRITAEGDRESIDCDSFTLRVSEEGRYFCTLNGKNNAFYKRASGNVFSERIITMGVVFDTDDVNGVDEPAGGAWIVWLIAGVCVMLLLALCVGITLKARKAKK